MPKNAKPTTPYFHDNYWKHPANQAIQIFDPGVPFGVPFAPTPFRVTFHVKAGRRRSDQGSAGRIPLREGHLLRRQAHGAERGAGFFGDGDAGAGGDSGAGGRAAKPVEREVHVTVTNGTKGAAQASVGARTAGGMEGRSRRACRCSFAHEDESLSARFQVTAPAQVKTGEYTLRAVVTSAATGEREVLRRIPGNRVSARRAPAGDQAGRGALKVVDVKTAPNLSVGYIVGVGDQVPPAIEQLGAKVTFIEPGRTGLGRPVEARRDHDRRPRLRAARRSARLQSPPAGLRRARRNGHRAIQQDGIQPGGVRPLPGEGQRQPRLR